MSNNRRTGIMLRHQSDRRLILFCQGVIALGCHPAAVMDNGGLLRGYLCADSQPTGHVAETVNDYR